MGAWVRNIPATRVSGTGYTVQSNFPRGLMRDLMLFVYVCSDICNKAETPRRVAACTYDANCQPFTRKIYVHSAVHNDQKRRSFFVAIFVRDDCCVHSFEIIKAVCVAFAVGEEYPPKRGVQGHGCADLQHLIDIHAQQHSRIMKLQYSACCTEASSQPVAQWQQE